MRLGDRVSEGGGGAGPAVCGYMGFEKLHKNLLGNLGKEKHECEDMNDMKNTYPMI